MHTGCSREACWGLIFALTTAVNVIALVIVSLTAFRFWVNTIIVSLWSLLIASNLSAICCFSSSFFFQPTVAFVHYQTLSSSSFYVSGLTNFLPALVGICV